MADQEATTRLLAGTDRSAIPGPRPNEATPIYYDAQQSPAARLFQYAFMVIIFLMVLISFILSIYRSVVMSNGMFVVLGLSLIGFLALNIILIVFVRKRDLPSDKSWFLYAMGTGILIESIFTNVMLFQ